MNRMKLTSRFLEVTNANFKLYNLKNIVQKTARPRNATEQKVTNTAEAVHNNE